MYDDAKNFTMNDLAAVKQDGKWGYINSRGEYAIQPMFDEAQEFGAGYEEFDLYASPSIALVKQEGKYACIDKKGTLLTAYADSWRYIGPLSDDGYFYVYLGNDIYLFSSDLKIVAFSAGN